MLPSYKRSQTDYNLVPEEDDDDDDGEGGEKEEDEHELIENAGETMTDPREINRQHQQQKMTDIKDFSSEMKVGKFEFARRFGYKSNSCHNNLDSSTGKTGTATGTGGTSSGFDENNAVYDEEEFNIGINFAAKMIGKMDVPRPQSKSEIVAAMRRIRFEFKARAVKKQRVMICVSVDGITVFIRRRQKKMAWWKEIQTAVFQHPVHRVFYVSHDAQDMKVMSYIARDSVTNTFMCLVFKTYREKDAINIVSAIGQAFEVCYKLNSGRIGSTSKPTENHSNGIPGASTAASQSTGQQDDKMKSGGGEIIGESSTTTDLSTVVVSSDVAGQPTEIHDNSNEYGVQHSSSAFMDLNGHSKSLDETRQSQQERRGKDESMKNIDAPNFSPLINLERTDCMIGSLEGGGDNINETENNNNTSNNEDLRKISFDFLRQQHCVDSMGNECSPEHVNGHASSPGGKHMTDNDDDVEMEKTKFDKNWPFFTQIESSHTLLHQLILSQLEAHSMSRSAVIEPNEADNTPSNPATVTANDATDKNDMAYDQISPLLTKFINNSFKKSYSEQVIAQQKQFNISSKSFAQPSTPAASSSSFAHDDKMQMLILYKWAEDQFKVSLALQQKVCQLQSLLVGEKTRRQQSEAQIETIQHFLQKKLHFKPSSGATHDSPSQAQPAAPQTPYTQKSDIIDVTSALHINPSEAENSSHHRLLCQMSTSANATSSLNLYQTQCCSLPLFTNTAHCSKSSSITTSTVTTYSSFNPFHDVSSNFISVSSGAALSANATPPIVQVRNGFSSAFPSFYDSNNNVDREIYDTCSRQSSAGGSSVNTLHENSPAEDLQCPSPNAASAASALATATDAKLEITGGGVGEASTTSLNYNVHEKEEKMLDSIIKQIYQIPRKNPSSSCSISACQSVYSLRQLQNHHASPSLHQHSRNHESIHHKSPAQQPPLPVSLSFATSTSATPAEAKTVGAVATASTILGNNSSLWSAKSTSPSLNQLKINNSTAK